MSLTLFLSHDVENIEFPSRVPPSLGDFHSFFVSKFWGTSKKWAIGKMDFSVLWVFQFDKKCALLWKLLKFFSSLVRKLFNRQPKSWKILERKWFYWVIAGDQLCSSKHEFMILFDLWLRLLDPRAHNDGTCWGSADDNLKLVCITPFHCVIGGLGLAL